jgi:hypothetical protein
VWDLRRPGRVATQGRLTETWLIHDDPVGVKWTWKRGCLASQSRMTGVLWVARLSQIRCTSNSAGTALSMARRNFLNSTARCWRWMAEMTVPSATLNANRLVTPWRW